MCIHRLCERVCVCVVTLREAGDTALRQDANTEKKYIPTYLPIYTRAYITKKPWLKLCRSCDVNIVILLYR